MKIENLKPFPKTGWSSTDEGLNDAYEAILSRLRYAKELLKEGPSYINREWDKETKAFIEKLNAEGL